MVVIDTNVASAIMRRQPEAMARLALRRPGDVYLSSPVAAEITYGLRRLPVGSKRRELLEREYARLRGQVRWIDWTEAAAQEFGVQKARIASADALIEDMDLIIGPVAIAARATLATYNIAHLGRLDGLVIEDWSGSTC